MFRKLVSLLLFFTILFAVASPAFASSDAVSYSASAYYPKPSEDEFSGWISFIDSDNNLYTYCWRFFPYNGLLELNNTSPWMDVLYKSDGNLYFECFTGLSEMSSLVIYRYYTSSSSNKPSVTLLRSDSFTVSREYAIPSVAPVAVAFGGNVNYGYLNNSYHALNITFSEDSNTDYNIELFYNYHKNMMDILYPALTAAFGDIDSIHSVVSSLINLLTSELVGSGDGSLANPYTIRDLLVMIANKPISEFSPSDLDYIESLLSLIESNSDSLEYYLGEISADSQFIFPIKEFLSELVDYFTCNNSFPELAPLLECVLSTVNEQAFINIDELVRLVTHISDVDLSDIKSLLTSISDEDLSAILSTLNDISTRCNYLVGIYNSLSNPAMQTGVISYINRLISAVSGIKTFLADGNSYSSFSELLESTLSVLNSDFYESFLKDHFARQESFYDKAEAFFEAYNSLQSDERLDYDDSKNNSWNIFAIFNRVVLKPFSLFWDQISSVFVFDSGSLSSDSVISDYLFYSSGLPGFNNLSDVDWSTLP